MSDKRAVSLSMGGRSLPLEIDRDHDVIRDHSLVGQKVEVSCIAGQSLEPRRGDSAVVVGVIERFGRLAALKVEIDGKVFFGSVRDFFLDRCVVEDAQPATATSAALRDGLSHWSVQHDYWHDQTDGLESMAWAVASVTPTAIAQHYEWGWDFAVPDPMRGDFTQVRCPAFQNGNFWTVTTAVSTVRDGMQPKAKPIEDHWARTFQWSYAIASGMASTFGWPWEQAARGIKARAVASAKVLVPLTNASLAKCLKARAEITGKPFDLGPRSVSVGFSRVRLKAGTIGMTEPPSDRRPYTVISISPTAAKRPEYMRQVVLHECVHVATASDGGPPHNDLFNAIAKRVGLKPEYRD